MSITTTKFIRKPLFVDAVRITGANFDEIAAWCQGEVAQDEVPGKGTGKKYIKVRVHNPKNARQTKAFVGDWLLYTERGYKVYTNKAFHASFDEAPQKQSITEAANAARAAEEHVYDDTIDLVPATPQGIAQAVAENEAARAANADKIADTTERQIQDLTEVASALEEEEVYTDSNVPVATVDTGADIREGKITENGAREKMGLSSIEPPENVETVPEQEKVEPAAAEGKRVLSIAEQKELTSDEVRELVQSGEAVLAQDIAAA